jgi:hypothetical protein
MAYKPQKFKPSPHEAVIGPLVALVMLIIMGWLIGLMVSEVHGDTLRVYMENDQSWHSDDDYTHGTRIEYSTDVFRLGAQQQMYTPYDLRNEEQVPGRHPYAGTLVGFAGWRPVHRFTGKTSFYGDYELQLGVLGPASHAEETQRFVHKIVGAKDPKGWGHQLHDEFIGQTALWEGVDWRFLGREDGWSAHLVAEAGGMLGTLQIAPGANADLKIGYGIEDSDAHHEMYVRAPKPKYGIYGLAGCSGRWWLRNELLDGNAHYVENHDTLTVDKEPLTGCLKAGFGVKCGRIELRMLWMWWTREYKTQESTPNYASASIGWEF